MSDIFSKVVNEADARGVFISNEQLHELQSLAAQNEARLEIVDRIAQNASAIVADSLKILLSEQPQLVALTGNNDMSTCLRDMEILLRYITYTMLASNISILEDRYLNGLRETYLSLNIPVSSVARSIQIMKEVTLAVLSETGEREHETLQDLEILIIKKLYPRQWVTIEITEFKDGFPSRGKVIFYDYNIDRLANKVSHFNGDIYTFFTGRIDDEPDSSFKRENDSQNLEVMSKFFNLSSEYPHLLSELSSYFNKAVSALE
jgi:phycocyanin beta chain